MRENLENQVAGARFGIECKNRKIGILEQQIAELKASHEREMQLIKNQHEARILEMEDEKFAAIEKAKETLMKSMDRTSDGVTIRGRSHFAKTVFIPTSGFCRYYEIFIKVIIYCV